jgi:K+ transporter
MRDYQGLMLELFHELGSSYISSFSRTLANSLSPLYVYSSTFTSPPSHQDLVGVLSIIIWTLTMMVTIKYVLVILHADNEGEGGTFSTYSLLSRFVSASSRMGVLSDVCHLGKHHEA